MSLLPGGLFSGCSERDALCCGRWASHFQWPPCCRAQALGTWTSGVVVHGLNSCDETHLAAHGTRDLPRPAIKPMSPALSGRFSTTEPWKALIFRILKQFITKIHLT